MRPSWSPDGLKLAYQSQNFTDDTPNWDIYVDEAEVILNVIEEAIDGPDGDMVDIRFAIAENISSQASFDAIKRIRNDYVPAAHCSDSKRYR